MAPMPKTGLRSAARGLSPERSQWEGPPLPDAGSAPYPNKVQIVEQSLLRASDLHERLMGTPLEGKTLKAFVAWRF